MSTADPGTAEMGSARASQELAELLLATTAFQDLMQEFAEISVQLVPASLTCGITIAHGGRILTVAATDSLGSQLDELQYQTDEGPCLQALRTGEIVIAPDLAKESRWAGYPLRAMSYGVSSVYSSPLTVRGEVLGVLNLYGGSVGAFDGDECAATIAQIVSLTALAMTDALRRHSEVPLTAQLQEALADRSIIDQAVGIIMGTRQCTAEEAFAVLRGAAGPGDIRLALVAQQMVDHTTDQNPPVDLRTR